MLDSGAGFERRADGETGEHLLGAELGEPGKSAEPALGAGGRRERCRYVVDVRGDARSFVIEECTTRRVMGRCGSEGGL